MEADLMSEALAKTRRIFEELLAQARAGSRRAFQELIEPFDQVIRFRARRRLAFRLRRKLNDSDVCQITYLKSFEHLHQFQGNTFEEFGCWLLGITDRVCQRVHQAYYCQARDIRREVPLENAEMKLTTNDSANGHDERNRRFEISLRELPARYREVIRLHYWEKCSHEEIGQRLGVSPNAAKHLHRRAMRKLADGAERYHDE
jgi:RNA polymerase sigma-70 factor (ECF subfamily)